MSRRVLENDVTLAADNIKNDDNDRIKGNNCSKEENRTHATTTPTIANMSKNKTFDNEDDCIEVFLDNDTSSNITNDVEEGFHSEALNEVNENDRGREEAVRVNPSSAALHEREWESGKELALEEVMYAVNSFHAIVKPGQYNFSFCTISQFFIFFKLF